MKLPDAIFVKHCPNLSPERKVFLEQHLRERVPIENVTWFEDYNHDHPFVVWLNQKLKLPYGVKLTSGMVKTLFMFKKMVDENIESVIMFDDDVTFHRDWVKYFESIPEEIEKIGFINLGTSPFFNLKPRLGQVYELPNNGGCEAVWCSRQFAHSFLNDLNLEEAGDIVLHGHMASNRLPILNVPICHQTSHIEQFSTLDHETRESSNWRAYVLNYANLPKISFNKLIEDFKKFEEKKQRLENKFEEIYGKKVNMKNIRYILNDDPDHRLNILEYELIEDKVNV